jgi:hypothetical protein
MKTCAGCKGEFAHPEFPQDRRNRDGLSRLCRACVSVRNAAYAKYHMDNPPEIPIEKRCPECGVTKPSGEFHRNRRRPDGLLYYCKECWSARGRRAKYGISDVEYQKMFDKQGGRCLICDEAVPLVVDHCHTSGRIRGLLCGNCNKGIGNLQESVANLERAIAYLQARTRV